MISFKKNTNTIIIIGTGGVGKTTTAAAIGFGKASEGKTVLVITIDPSKRLAQAMDFKPDGNIYKIATESKKGALFASAINHTHVFNEFINEAKSLSNESDLLSLSKNKLFQQLTTRLSQSQDFTTLYYLYAQVQSDKYDYVILDTPPAQHTWTFLESPEKIMELFSKDVISWFSLLDKKPTTLIQKFLMQGSGKIVDIFQALTGSEFINELKSFFVSISSWQKPLTKTVLNCQKLLVSKNTEFILITNFDQNKFNASKELSRKIYNEGYNLTHFVINMMPDWTDEKSDYKNETVDNFRFFYKNTLTSMTDQLSYFHNDLKVYKSINLSQNITHAEMYKIYNQIKPVN